MELIKDQSNDIKELAKILNTSIPTIYRDIRTLLKKNKIKKNYNDIKVIDNIEENYKNIIITKLGQRIEQNKIEKISIAKEAAKLVNTGDNIILDESSTSYYLAKELKNRNIPITIITNSVLIPQEFLENNLVRIINTGGVLDSEVGGFVGT
ncbi:MAG: DeoR family transcriptional regulator, partial [Actinobacteria bacterium]|nr:DeoR family transcriptional regulator [Actinomycetota bacterium]